MSDDPGLNQLRAQIGEQDRTILEAVNRRVELVAQIKAYKDANGIDFVDPGREAQLLDDLATANRGPLSEQGLRELFETVLALTKRELA